MLLVQEHHPARSLASLHPLFSLGGLSPFVSYFSLHAILSPGWGGSGGSLKVSNCKQIISPYLFILIVSIVLGLVLPGILNRLPLLSGVCSRLLPLTCPALRHKAERAPSPRTHQRPSGGPRKGQQRVRLCAGCLQCATRRISHPASLIPPAEPRLPAGPQQPGMRPGRGREGCGRRQVPASAAPRRRR